MSTLAIQANKARLKVRGKSWGDIATDSGDGLTIDQITINDLKDYGFDLPNIDDDTHILVGYDDGTWLYIDGMEPIDLGDFDLSDLDLDWEIGTLLPFDGSLLGVDDDLNITEELLADHIEIVTLPLKLEYEDGETINIFGMRVVPKNADGSTWTNSKYFRGNIPLQELIVSPLNADISQTSSNKQATSDIPQIQQYVPFEFSNKVTGYFWSYGQKHDWEINAAPYTAVVGHQDRDGQYTRIVKASKNNPTGTSSQYTYKGKTVYYESGYQANYSEGVNPVIMGISYTDSSFDDALAWTMIWGDIIEGGQIITVTWLRYGDKEPLSATFEIEVTDDPGGGGR